MKKIDIFIKPMASSHDHLQQEVTRLEEIVSGLFTLCNFLSQKYKLQDFLSLVLTKVRQLTSSDAGSIYLIDRDSPIPCICFAVSQNSSYPEKSLTNFAIPLTKESLVGYVAITAEILNIPNADTLPANTPYRHHKSIESDIEYITQSVLTLPVTNTDGIVIAVIQLINRKVDAESKVVIDNITDLVIPFSDPDVALLRSVASLAAVSIERHYLLNPTS